jgi:hypothetical protein
MEHQFGVKSINTNFGVVWNTKIGVNGLTPILVLHGTPKLVLIGLTPILVFHAAPIWCPP